MVLVFGCGVLGVFLFGFKGDGDRELDLYGRVHWGDLIIKPDLLQPGAFVDTGERLV